MKAATAATIVLLTAVALAHALRFLLRVPVTIADVAVPQWVSVVGTLLPAALALGLWRERGVPSRETSCHARGIADHD